MKIHEYQARQILSDHGIPVPQAEVAFTVDEAVAAVETAAAGIRARRFEATPSRHACRWCAYRQICPFTATRE